MSKVEELRQKHSVRGKHRPNRNIAKMPNGRFRVRFRVDGRLTSFGCHETIEEARTVRDEVEAAITEEGGV